MSGPLSGIKILDLTTVGFGPYATQILGDYGADIIKLESPEGDITRGIGPYRKPGMGHFFLNANRNKRSIVIDLKNPQGLRACQRLVQEVDVVISSVRPAAMERLGLGYADCQALNPSIIYVALVGFGQEGPYGPRPAYDDIIQGLSGMADMQGGREGPPRFVNASICDKIGSQFAVHATMAALFHRLRSGEGQLVEVPMLESLVGFNLVEHASGQSFVPAEGPAGYDRTLAEHRRPYATADGYVCVLPYNTKQWRAFFELVGRTDLVDAAMVNEPGLRSEKIGELYALVAEHVAKFDTEQLLAALHQADIPHGRATPLGELEQDEHLRSVGMFEQFEHPTEGPLRLVRPGVKLDKTPATIRSLPANLGEHSYEILREVGFTDAEIAELFSTRISLDGRVAEKADAAD